LSPIPSRFNHSIKDWQCRQMWFFVLCQEHSTDINCQCQLHWHPIKTNKVVDRLFQDRISFWEEKGSFTDSMFIVCLQLSLWWLWIYFSSGRCNDLWATRYGRPTSYHKLNFTHQIFQVIVLYKCNILGRSYGPWALLTPNLFLLTYLPWFNPTSSF
jgi:hypothetical protein